MRLRAGKTGSGKGAGRMVAQAIATARAAGATGKILVRGDSAYGNRAVVRACRRGKAEFSLVMTKNPAIARAIASIPDTAWTPVRYPGAVQDPDTGAWISDAEVAEVPYTAFAAHHRTGSPPGWWCAGSKTPATPTRCSRSGATTRSSPTPTLPTAQADIVHRRHAIIETVFADLIDGPLAHLPSGHFGANSAWALCAAIAHNLLHAAGTLAGRGPTPSPAARPCADGSSPCPPDSPDPPAHPSCTYPAAGPGPRPGYSCGTRPSATAHPPPPDPHPADNPARAPRSVEKLDRPATPARLQHRHA